MRDRIVKFIQALLRLFHRFQQNQPSNPYEQILFGGVRSAIATAIFPPKDGLYEAQ